MRVIRVICFLFLFITILNLACAQAPSSPNAITAGRADAGPAVLEARVPSPSTSTHLEPGQLSREDIGAATVIEPAQGPFIRPNLAPIAPSPFITPREAGTYSAKRIWGEKLREADEQGFNWAGAIVQSAVLLAIEETYRLSDQPYTREALKGPFLDDWFTSVRNLHGWHDTDSWLANYVGHPMQGAVTGYFQIQNDPRGRLQEFGWNKGYWKSRLKAFGWAFAYSTLYEVGPLGDAAIGNVGHPDIAPDKKGYVDIVITPTLGLALLVIEDAIDRHIVWPLEKRTNNAMAKRFLRSFLGMHRSFSNLFRLKLPWYIDSRGPVNQPAIRYSQLPY